MGKLFSMLLLLAFLIWVAGWLQSEMGIAPEIIWPTFILAFLVSAFVDLVWTLRWPVIVAPTAFAWWLFAFQGADRSVMLPGLAISALLFLLLGLPPLMRRLFTRKPAQPEENRRQG